MKTLTIKQERQVKQRTLTDRICTMIGLTPDQVSQLMFDTACEYIEYLAPLDEVAREFLSEPMYWNWWRQQWALVDEAFIFKAAGSSLSREQLLSWYKVMHREIDTFPDPLIWDQIHTSYMNMAKQVINKKTHKPKLKAI